jgi:acyl-CoA synthetase (NDP forming)
MPRDLRPLFDPASVAILGASDDPAKWGNWLARGALRGSHRRPVYLVNRNGGEVLGTRAYASVTELPEAPELVVIAVPAAGFEQAVDDSLAMGARALVGITAGLGEAGGDAATREQALVQRVRDAGAMLLGPNCLGVYDASSDLGLASNEFPPGSIGLISQSGNLALELGLMSRRYSLGFSRFASIGNQADLDLAELVASYAEHPATELIAVYAEDFRDGRAFAAAAAAAQKPVILITVGRSDASARAARSHTGALVSSLATVRAACRGAGVHLVSTPAEMIDLAQALLQPRRLAGRRIAVLGDGGGHGAIACDVAADMGLELPVLSDELQAKLAGMLPPMSSVRNPIDLAGAGEADFSSYSRVARALLEADELDGVLMTGYFGGYSQYSEQFADTETEVGHEIARAAVETGKPLVAQSMYADDRPNVALREGGVPVYWTIEAAAASLAALEQMPAATGPPALLEPVMGPLDAGYFGSRAMLADAGVPFVAARSARMREDVLAAAAEVGYPVVLKALGLLHKSDSGGVNVGLADADALAAAWSDMERRLSPPGYSVEAMAPVADGIELIVGARRDPRFGPVALVGLGGIYAELLGDVGVALAPLDRGEAMRLLESLQGAALLEGARGRAAVDVGAAADAAVALSRLAAARPDIAEIEVNPLLVTPEGALALDARIIPADKGGDDAG